MSVMRRPHYCPYTTKEILQHRPNYDENTPQYLLHAWHNCWGDERYVQQYKASLASNNARNKHYRRVASAGIEPEQLDRAREVWTEREVEYLIEHYYTTDTNRLARILGRSITAIERKVSKLKQSEDMQ